MRPDERGKLRAEALMESEPSPGEWSHKQGGKGTPAR